MNAQTESGGTVLFVDDEESIATLVTYALEFSGYTVLTAHTGLDALRVYEERHVDLDVVLVDYVLPDMRGDQLVARMCEIDSTPPFVAMSGHSRDEVASALHDRTVMFLHKPFDLRSLAGRLREVVHAAAL